MLKFFTKHQDYFFLLGGVIVGFVILQISVQGFFAVPSNQVSTYLDVGNLVIYGIGSAFGIYIIGFCLFNIYAKLRRNKGKNHHER